MKKKGMIIRFAIQLYVRFALILSF
uniref:Uncharacterized protein n=1 Tax=Heterorhabditis bacteriophora TaxID=37862 RepID=A0A1I7WJE9_HETBA